MAAARELLVSGRKTLALFELFFGENHSARNELSDDIARDLQSAADRLP